MPPPHPVFLSPAEIPLIVAAMARFTSGVSSPALFRRSMSTCIRCIGSTYGFRSRIDRPSTLLIYSSSVCRVTASTAVTVLWNSASNIP
jgi:hypothetical protein